MEYTEIDYLRSAGFVMLGTIAVIMTLLIVGRWLYRRRVKRSHSEMTRVFGPDWK